ncbi:MAG: DNA polymerase II large subunit, partial [Candidatus Odinarchaeia archaeon]
KIKAIDVLSIYQKAVKRLMLNNTIDVKCVKGMMSRYKIPESIEKGLLRAKYGLSVYKDGTIRYDMTDSPLTHFKPREVGAPIQKLIQLGYTHDYKNQPLTSDEQILELKVQDIVIPWKAGEYLLKVSKFIDELLEKHYGLSPYYKAEKPEDLIGHLVMGLAPHTSAAIMGRIIGFTTANMCYAHPYWHAAKRRNCDSDEDSILLTLDALLNFSKFFLPEKRGGMMDAPLVVSIRLNPLEVDDEVWNMDTGGQYPLEFYESTLEMKDPKSLSNLIPIVEHRLDSEEAFEGILFTHSTQDINTGPSETSYKKLSSMPDKVKAQLEIAEKVKAVDESDVALRILKSHFIPDIIGNLGAFTKQQFRCQKCNKKYRRIPLYGVCSNNNCGGKILPTVYKGGIEKYLEVAENIIEKYNLPRYLSERLEIIKMNIESIFENDKIKQSKLSQFF